MLWKPRNGKKQSVQSNIGHPVYHEKQTSVCNNFEIGVCDFEEKDCWFLHRKSLLTKLNCTKCEKTFKGRSEFFIHRKHNHPELVKKCKNEERFKY